MHVIFLKTIYWMSSHQNLSIRLISILLFSQLPLFTYLFRQYLLGGNENSFHRFCKVYKQLAKFPGLVQCDLGDRWIYIKCADINQQKYEKLKKDFLAWYCADCTTEIPFSTLSNKDFKDFLYSTTTPQPSQILQKSSKEIKKMMSRFKQVNQLFDQSENSISCDYYDINGFSKIVIKVILLSYT